MSPLLFGAENPPKDCSARLAARGADLGKGLIAPADEQAVFQDQGRRIADSKRLKAAVALGDVVKHLVLRSCPVQESLALERVRDHPVPGLRRFAAHDLQHL